MKNVKKTVLLGGLLAVACTATFGISYAAFSDKGKYSGSTFNVASADIKLLSDVSQGADLANLVDEKPGPVFNNIGPSWTSDYTIKLYNNATTPLNIFSTAYYETLRDPGELRGVISCEIFEWNDVNANGTVDEGEIGGSYGAKTIIKWKTEGIQIGQLSIGEAKGYILRFTTTSTFSSLLQGKTGEFDFEFTATGI
jgi:hypothetical protein